MNASGTQMKDTAPDPRIDLILNAATHAFATYGFRKTSMADIARGAGMSRPALYMHYRNKEDICRTLIERYYLAACHAVAQALARPGPADQVLLSAFEAQGGEMVKALLTSPHGLELLDSSAAFSADLVGAGEAALSALYADWLVQEHEAGRIELPGSARETADLITAGLKGLKATRPDYEIYCAHRRQLALLIGRGLAAGGT